MACCPKSDDSLVIVAADVGFVDKFKAEDENEAEAGLELRGTFVISTLSMVTELGSRSVDFLPGRFRSIVKPFYKARKKANK